ncbi:MAG: hypothetical protein EU548_06035 [Promethearchaeota archaeon]|nr:MAG: hypothetical protein EU548_06035 [Candidatus Lokiarchaeota archaeon]
MSFGSSLLLNQYNEAIEQNAELPQLSLSEDWVSPWSTSGEEYGRGLAIDESTGELFTVGYNGTSTNHDVILIKYNNLGYQLWNITWDDGANELGYDVALDSQKYIYIAGGNGTISPDLDGLLLKFNPAGDLIWKVSYDGGSYDNFWALYIDDNDNIYVVSQSILGTYDTVVLKYNSTGDLQWTSTFGGSGYQTCYDIMLDGDGNIFLAGLNGSAPSFNYLIVKMDNSGNHLWNRTWGGPESDQAFAVGIDPLNNIYITGFSNSFSANKDITLVKYDDDGNKLWNTTWGSSYGDESWTLDFDSAGYAYVAGHRGKDIVILKFDTVGNIIWDKYWERLSIHVHWCYDLIIDSNDNIYFTGNSLLTIYNEIITVKLSIDSPGGVDLWSDADDPDENGEFTLYWSVSPRVSNYSLFYSNESADIDIETELPWVETIMDNDIDVTLGNGTYYFLVVAYNDYGYAVSNYESVTVEIQPTSPPDGPPGIPGYALLTISLSMLGVIFAIVVRTKKTLK